MKARRLKGLLLVTLSIPAMVGLVGATPAGATLSGDVEISGHGYGHGRGLSQYGARGYAVDHGWSSAQILNHYYGGTAAHDVGDVPIGVELMSRAGKDLVVTAPSLRVNGQPLTAAAVLVRRTADGKFNVYTGDGCASRAWRTWRGGWTDVVVANGASASDPANHVQICESGQVRGYRGDFHVVSTGSSSAVVNRLMLEEYLRGVLPREMPASWADLGGGRGAQALQSQAVAARSYAIASPRNWYSTTCDTTTCQVYGGEYTRPINGTTRTSLEDPRSNAAIAATEGVVRRNSAGKVARTEFSSSSGGYTAGGTFPAVPDAGDGTAANPNRNWSVSVNAGTLAARLGTPAITGMEVTQRNGLGADGGRVLRVVVDTVAGEYSFTGGQFRSRVGLKSDWFRFNVRGYGESVSFTKALYHDILGRGASTAEVGPWADLLAGGASTGGVARAILTSDERLRRTVGEAYQAALNRGPDPVGQRSWFSWLRGGRTVNDLNAAMFGSAESLEKLGGGDVRLWVDGLYRATLDRGAGAAERDHWARVAATRGRNYVAFHISASEEGRRKRLVAYYGDLLQRGVDAAGMRTWIPRMMHDGDIQVQEFIASSSEYWDKARTRFP
jgi:SpoIID/LytB domain protein